MTPFPVGTRIREIATGDLGTVCESPKYTHLKLPDDIVWACWEQAKSGQSHSGWLPASEVEAVTE